MSDAIVKYVKQRNPLLFFILTSTLIFGVFSVTIQTSFAAESSTPIIIIPNKADVYFSNWGTYGTTPDKVSAVTDNTNNTGIARTSSGKAEGYGLSSANVASTAKITRVVIEVTAKNTGPSTNTLNLTWLTGTTNKDISTGPNNSVSTSNYVKITRSETINPFTKVAWTPNDVNTWKFGTKQIAAGLNVQTKQNTEKINVGEVRVLVYLEKDTTSPIIKLQINNVEKSPSVVSNTWYNQNVNVKWIVTDPESGVSSSTGCSEQNVITDTSGTIFSCTATNNDGLTTPPISVTIKRDTVKPDIVLDDSADGTVDNIITVQADQTTGKIVAYSTTASDDSSGIATGPTCIPVSGTLFAIADTAITCNAADNAGNSATEIYTVRVLPFIFIALGTEEHPIYQNDLTDVLVADPAANTGDSVDTITVVLDGDAACPIFPCTANAILNETSPGVFEGQVIFSEQENSDSTSELPANLYSGLGTLVWAIYDSADNRGTSITPAQPVINKTPPGEGGAAFIASLPAISWNSDAAHIETTEGITIKRASGQNGCPTTPNAVKDTATVKVTSPSDATGFTLTLTETANTSCVFSTSANVKLTTANSAVSTPKIKTASGQKVTATDLTYPTNTATILILPAPLSAPTSGVGLDTISIDCGVGGDTDSDGICNVWEPGDGNPLTVQVGGGEYFYSNDGFSCTRLIDHPTGDAVANPILVDNVLNPETCPEPNKKDIFYEIDYMPNHLPNYMALLDVINAFKNAPSPSPSCLTCPGPINVHFKIDEQITQHDKFIPWSASVSTSNPLGGFDQIKQAYFGTSAERTNPATLVAERQVMRYILFSHQQEETLNQKSSGYAEIYGNDIQVSLGAFSGGTGTRMEQGATVMHEIGHNIGLNHGGSATNSQNCKPNQISVMNYAYQFTNYVPTRPLDFSRVQLNNLDENSLSETVGISSPGVAMTSVYGPSNVTPTGIRSIVLSATANTPIDWDRSGAATATGVSRDVNYLGFAGCMADDGYPAKTILTSSIDWANTNLFFRTTASTFADGIQALNPINKDENFGNYEPTSDVISIGSGEPPVINSGGPYSVNEGDTVTLDASASTDSDGIVEIYRWNFGDLDAWDEPGIDVLGSQAIIFADDDDNSPFTTLLGIWDDSANGVDTTVNVNVLNVSPTISAPISLPTINEGDTLTIDDNPFTFTDPGIIDTHSATIDWGDGANDPGTVHTTTGIAPTLEPPSDRIDATGTVKGTHTYLDDDSDDTYTITATVQDDDAGSSAASIDVVVLNVAPEITDISVSGGTFTDPGKDTWYGTIDYGDGQNADLIFDDNSFTIPPHTYTCGINTSIVTINDDDGGSDTASFDVMQSYCSPTFLSPLPGSQYELSRTVPVKISLTDNDGSPITNAQVSVSLLQNGNSYPVGIATYSSSSGTYNIQIKLNNYPVVIGPVEIIAELETGQTVSSGVIQIK